MGMVFFLSRCLTVLPGFLSYSSSYKMKKASSLCNTTEFKALSAPKGLAGIPQCWIKLIPAL